MARSAPERLRALARLVWGSITPLGRSALGAAVACWLLAAWFGWAELAVIAAACLLALLIGIGFLLASRTNLRVASHLATPRVVVGNDALVEVATTNPSSRRLLPFRMETRVGDGVAPLHVPTLVGGATHQEDVHIATSRRAVVPVGPVRSVQGDPLGLVRREVLWTGTDDLFVHPRTVAVGALTTGWMRDLEGETTNDRSPSDVAFHTLREYVVGDDRRHVHWRTTARQADGKLMVREFVDTRRAHLALVLSLAPGDYRSADEFELAVSVVGSLGLRALADEQQVTCVAGGHVLPSYHGMALLDALAGVDLDDAAPDLATTIGRARDALSSASVGVVAAGSGAETGRVRAAADRMGQHVHAIIVRADLAGESMFRRAAQTPLVELADLEDLPRMIRVAAAS